MMIDDDDSGRMVGWSSIFLLSLANSHDIHII